MVSPYQFTLPGIAQAAVVSKGSYVGMTLHTNIYLLLLLHAQFAVTSSTSLWVKMLMLPTCDWSQANFPSLSLADNTCYLSYILQAAYAIKKISKNDDNE